MDKKNLYEMDLHDFYQYIVPILLRFNYSSSNWYYYYNYSQGYASKPVKSEVEKKMKTLES